MEIPKKPVPIVNDWARPFWDAAKEQRLVIQKCKDCEKHIFYPRIACPHCSSDNVEWVDASGKGTVYSYTVVESNSPSAFLKDIPYVVAVVRLEEGVQMLSNVVGCEPGEVRCDMPVEVTFEKLDDEFTLPKFKPATR
ncbi:MAG: Zn-ribbon domain-containing OB-fold protein [Desulfomonile tiedjei]|uniref:Zn-ribbon domain-containing OB-fold protein n=1 Tax=Desulfomonile tiedjei TaxID=2358 RepID=A0A9D6Z2I4_9BACT|nr:Zn-ribbon domain-containing OB-fold protein [Desulfomonile tiedjei]